MPTVGKAPSGVGCGPIPENFGTFSLEMANSGANSVVYFNRNVKLFTARTTTVTVSYWGGLWGRGCDPPQ